MKFYPVPYKGKWAIAYDDMIWNSKNVLYLFPVVENMDQICYDRLTGFNRNVLFYNDNPHFAIKIPVFYTEEEAQSAIDNVIQDWNDANELLMKISSSN